MSKTAMVRVVTPERYEELRKILPGLPCGQDHSRARMVAKRDGTEATRPTAEWIEVRTEPEEPPAVWFCGTSRVWQVTDTWLAAHGYVPESGMAVRVCEHQVEID